MYTVFISVTIIIIDGSKFFVTCTCMADVMHSPNYFVCVCVCADIPQLKSEAESKQLYVVELPQGTDEETFRTHGELIIILISLCNG